MHVLVCPHELTMGGSQLNALELAREVRNEGHRVTVCAAPDVLITKIQEFGLDYVPAPLRRRPFDIRAARALARTARGLNIDVVHCYEWPSIMDGAYGPTRMLGIPTVMTVLSMDVPDFLPHHLPLIVGTQRLAEGVFDRGREVHVMEPPIDTDSNSPDAVDNARASFDLDEGSFVIAVVGRLSAEHEKYLGVLEAISVVDDLARSAAVTLLIVGDGEGMPLVRNRAEQVNTRHGARTIRVEGNVLDPRAAYAVADVILGMGSSALKGMAFGKPVIVQGAQGFWSLLTPESQHHFLSDGFFGHGGGGAKDLEPVLRDLLADAGRRSALGVFGRELVEVRFELRSAAKRLVGIYADAVAAPAGRSRASRSLARTAFEFSKFRVALQTQSLRRIPAQVPHG